MFNLKSVNLCALVVTSISLITCDTIILLCVLEIQERLFLLHNSYFTQSNHQIESMIAP